MVALERRLGACRLPVTIMLLYDCNGHKWLPSVAGGRGNAVPPCAATADTNIGHAAAASTSARSFAAVHRFAFPDLPPLQCLAF